MLIRKDFKPTFEELTKYSSLRVLLIRKDFKLLDRAEQGLWSLRVLLIRKDFKLNRLRNGDRVVFESLVNTEGF